MKIINVYVFRVGIEEGLVYRRQKKSREDNYLKIRVNRFIVLVIEKENYYKIK